MKQKNFLLINPFGIGDVLFSTPVIRALKKETSESKIYYLCNSRCAGFVAENPYIEAVIVYDRDNFEALRKKSFFLWLREFSAFIKNIREKKIDVSLDFSMNTYFGLFALLGGVQRRVGLDYKKRGRFLTDRIPLNGFEGKHVVEFYADVLRRTGIEIDNSGMDMYYPESLRVLSRRKIIGMAPAGGQAFGAHAHVKQWPCEKYVELVKKILNNTDYDVMLFGAAFERDVLERIAGASGNSSRVAVICDKTMLEVSALIDICDVFAANDTGLLRVADALKKKCVALFGPVDDKVYGLYPEDKNRHRLLCTRPECWPCYRRFRLPECTKDRICINGITPEQVYASIKELMDVT